MFATRTYDISPSVESPVPFNSEFHAKLQEIIVRQTDHPWQDLESPSGFIGRIWRSGDLVSTAPVILNMCPRWCVNGVTVWGKVKDTTAKVTIMQNQFPCISQKSHWSHFRCDHGSCIALLGYIRTYDFCYVFLASLTLDFYRTKISLHHAPNMCVYVIKWNFIVIW